MVSSINTDVFYECMMRLSYHTRLNRFSQSPRSLRHSIDLNLFPHQHRRGRFLLRGVSIVMAVVVHIMSLRSICTLLLIDISLVWCRHSQHATNSILVSILPIPPPRRRRRRATTSMCYHRAMQFRHRQRHLLDPWVHPWV
jgi:hypothetical protein